jgi:dTDP-4-dehydrorhamnose reductase
MHDRQSAPLDARAEPASKLEVWGGVECTVNRVGDRYHDQLRRNGHLERPEDLDRFVELGLKTLRFPVLWELAADESDPQRFARFDPLLERARSLGIRVIAGLVHHGSGPANTHLLDPSFELGLARFAATVSQRYPWIEDYTPVNEPLTTARFSALYGHWYPHARSPRDFLRALLNETRGTIRAMAEIRKHVPHARLIQTEDIGSVTGTPLLAYQAEHENVRRWLSLDMLTAKLTPSHPLYQYVRDVGGVSADELAWLEQHACPPDIIGVNYYFTSDRFLDERLERHPSWSHGSNGRHAYADVHCTMLPEVGLRGHRKVLQEVWERYRLPIAITEVHAGCSREDQLRWLSEAWEAAHASRDDKIDVQAVTVWSLLGSFDWNALVTVERGVYEPGVFDLRAPEPRPTELARMVKGLSLGSGYDHPVLDGEGWWRRSCTRSHGIRRVVKPRALAIVGATGTLGQALAAACEQRGLTCELLDRKRLDLQDGQRVEQALSAIRPWAVINAAGYVRVDDAERDRARCLAVNAQGAARLAEVCQRLGARMVTFSSDLVFDGQTERPYVERDTPAPLSVYGHSKLQAEQRVTELLPQALIVRTSAFFGPRDRANFVTETLRRVGRGEHVRAAADVTVSPTYVPHLVDACLDLLIDGATGIYHLANQSAVSWFELAKQAAQAASLSDERIVPCRLDELGLAARRPAYSALGSERVSLMPSLEQGLEQYVRAVHELARAAASEQTVAV